MTDTGTTYSKFTLKMRRNRDQSRGGTSNPLSVVHIVDSVDRGGVEMRTLEVLQAIPRETVRTFVVTLSGREGVLAEDYRAAGARIVPIRLRSAGFLVRFMLFLVRNRISAVHSHIFLASGPILALARLAKVRNRIAHFQTDRSSRNGGVSFRSIRYSIMRSLIRLNATRIVGVSPSALQQWDEDWRNDERCVVLVHGFALERFGSGHSSWRAEIGITDTEPSIMHVGRADLPSKNRDGAIDVFGAYAKGHDRGVLVFIGRDGKSEREALQNRSRWNDKAVELDVADRIFFIGERADVPEILGSADMLLLTSTMEGLPGVVVEARAAGMPVVATDIAGCVFIASMIDGVECLSLGAPLSVWSDAVEHALAVRPTLESRAAVRDGLRGSEFDVHVSAQRYVSLWSQ